MKFHAMNEDDLLFLFRHPDKNKDPDATAIFTKINEAYEVRGSGEDS